MKKLILPIAAAAALAIAACGPAGEADESPPGDVFPGFTEVPTPVDPLATDDEMDDEMDDATDDAMDDDDPSATESPAL